MDPLKLTLCKANLSVTSGEFSISNHVERREEPNQPKIEFLEQLPIFGVFAVEKHVINDHMISAVGHCRDGISHAFRRSPDYISGLNVDGLAVYTTEDQSIFVLNGPRGQHRKEVIHLDMQKRLFSNLLNSFSDGGFPNTAYPVEHNDLGLPRIERL